MFEFQNQISYTMMSILEGEILRTSLQDWQKDELINSLIWASEEDVPHYWQIIEANRVYDSPGDLDYLYTEKLNDPKQ